MSSLRIAVASKDGISINQHFGHAREFLIFDVSKRLDFLVARYSFFS